MRRFYVPKSRWKGERARLSPDQCRHLTRVLRMGPGDSIAVFDGEREYEARIVGAGKSRRWQDKGGAWCEITKKPAAGARHASPLQITLAPAILKAKRMDMVIEKAAELGASRIAPFVSSRCVVKVGTAKLSHWRKIAESAASQSGRVKVPEICQPASFDEILRIEADLKVMLLQEDSKKGLDQIISRWRDARALSRRDLKPGPTTVMLVVGPEGGFSEDEVQKAKGRGFLTWGLGAAVLRAETASIAGLAILTHALIASFD